MDSFESQLARQKPREIPTHWKAGVVAAAHAAAKKEESHNDNSFFFELFVKLRYGWGALAAIWLVLAGYQLTLRDDPAYTVASDSPGNSVQVIAQGRRDLEQLLAADRSKPDNVYLRPRSEIRIQSAHPSLLLV